MDDFSNVHIDDYVEIMLFLKPTDLFEGEVFKVLSKNKKDPSEILTNGDKDRVIQIINSEDMIKKKIMSEDQYTENKEIFSEDVMQHEVIPKTIQSFLNSEGDYLYIGIKDTGEL